MAVKTCQKCSQQKEETEFYFRKYQDRGNTCIECEALYKIVRRYNITIEHYQKMLKDQKGRCKICGNKPIKRRLAVDHDHSCCPGAASCGRCVRGLLCISCNHRLASVEDITWLNNATIYLKEYQ